MSSSVRDDEKAMFMSEFAAKNAAAGGPGMIVTEADYKAMVDLLDGWDEMSGVERTTVIRLCGVERSKAYRWARNFMVKTEEVDGGDPKLHLVARPKEEGASTDAVAAMPALDDMVYVLHQGNMFEELMRIHEGAGHQKSRGFELRVKQHWCRVPRWVTELVVECCSQCNQRAVRKVSTAGHKPILTKGLGNRGQVDLIDFQSCPDGEYKFLLNYQDHGIKLYDCRPLTSKRNTAVAFALLDIFSFIGAPSFLQVCALAAPAPLTIYNVFCTVRT